MREFRGDQLLAMAYASARLRADFAALLRFDAVLGLALTATHETVLSQLRLAWWRDALIQPGGGDPTLVALKKMMRAHDVTPAQLTLIIDGWEVLLDTPSLSDDRLIDYARARGAGLFAVAARIAAVAPDDNMVRAGTGWALADFARHCENRETAQRAMILAGDVLCGNVAAALPKLLRPFAILSHFAAIDAKRGLDRVIVSGAPNRITQALGFVLFRR